MQLGLAIAIALLVIGVVAWPLLVRAGRRGQRAAGDSQPPGQSREERGALEAVYEAIRTLQTDYELGRLPAADYQEQLAGYRRQAAVILRRMDQSGDDESGEPA